MASLSCLLFGKSCNVCDIYNVMSCRSIMSLLSMLVFYFYVNCNRLIKYALLVPHDLFFIQVINASKGTWQVSGGECHGVWAPLCSSPWLLGDCQALLPMPWHLLIMCSLCKWPPQGSHLHKPSNGTTHVHRATAHGRLPNFL